LNGYIFSSEDLAPQVRGFGGKMNLAVYIGTTGKLIDFHIIHSNETPAYMEMLTQWHDSLKGRVLFNAEPFNGLDAVTGATVSSETILTSLQKSGHKFATQVLGHSLRPGAKEKATIYNYLPDITGTYLIVAFVLSLIIIYYGGFWSRLAVLCFNLIAGGIVLNAQYSTEQITTILSFNTPAIGLSGTFVLIIGIPFLVIFFGNIYCGYICPFGAMQEMLGFIVPRKYKPVTSEEAMQKARFIKYIVLFVLLMVFFLSRERTTLIADPLISSFNPLFLLSLWDRLAAYNFQLLIFLIIAIALIVSVFYTRFWCRYLCPVGAFLSLFANFPVPKLRLPPKNFGKCEFGLTYEDKIDCIYCDKCRFEKAKSLRTQKQKVTKVFLPCVLVVSIFVIAVSIGKFLQTMPAGFEQVAVSVSAGGQPRRVDIQRVRGLIQQKRLSDKEARFYRKIEQKETQTTDESYDERF
jgi:NosR/NirI family nitrous oxide reductase transcriptional regulator